jgi:hypothetical protein
METDNVESNLEQIVSVLTNIERENLYKNPQIQDWILQITKPEFQLVDSLISLFMNSLNDLKTSRDILKVLR